MCLLTGHYAMLRLTVNSLGVEPEPAALAGPAAAAANQGLADAPSRRCGQIWGNAVPPLSDNCGKSPEMRSVHQG
ncbi:MAG: hypothetical protein ACJ72N_01660 [Labedaea sp.]